ncbi:MAG: hypothetical protein GX061_09135, partial [Eubacteriaceae bacterium]|nr:hypothetical protein [Eubacteriaceae bacterium]
FVTKVGELDGLTLTKETAFYEMVGAKNGYKLTDKDTGEVMEIYAFDKASDAYKKAETDQKLTIESMSYSFDVKTSNGYAILLPENFPQKDAVLGLFNTLQ